MAETKVYKKKGRYNYKEQKLIDAIREKIVEKQTKDPNFTVEPATSFEQLKHLHNELVAEDASFEEVHSSATGDTEPDQTQTSNMSEETAEVEEQVESSGAEESSAGREFVDPFNRDEPIVRDYVLGDDDYPESDDPTGDKEQPSTFDEPTSEQDAFNMDDEPEDGEKSEKASSGSGDDKKSENKKEKEEPVNPAFDQMSKKKQKRATERFAKHIVTAVCALAEKGFVYWTTRKINEAKLVEYEITGEVDLSILLELEGGQEATVKQFFQSLNMQAEQMSKISPEDKEDLTDALVEVLMEKGFAPSPSQNLLIIGGSILGQMALNGIMLNQQINSVIRLASNDSETSAAYDYEQAAEHHSQAAAEHEQAAHDYEQAAHAQEENYVVNDPEETEGVIEEPIEEENLLLEENPLKTKE